MPPRRPRRPARQPATARAAPLYEVDVLPGLEAVAQDEIVRRLGHEARLRPPLRPRPGLLGFEYVGEVSALLRLQTVVAAYAVAHFAIPRPRALLGDQHWRTLLAQVARVRGLWPATAYQTLYVSAAGAESPVMRRLKDELTRQTGLAAAPEEGDLLLRLRPALYTPEGWEVSLRLSPRPLATRPWRVCHMEGALNATVAQAMVRLTHPAPDDVFLNLACGSGTLLIERRSWGPGQRIVGCDTDAAARECAARNIVASGYAGEMEVHPWDATALPCADASVDALCADLPFGHLVGSHEQNVALYPPLLREAARVAKPSARCVIITHEVRLMETLLREGEAWETEAALPVFLGGLHPRIFALRRR